MPKANHYGRMLDQIETCYRQYTPPQIAQNQPKPKKQRRRRTS